MDRGIEKEILRLERLEEALFKSRSTEFGVLYSSYVNDIIANAKHTLSLETPSTGPGIAALRKAVITVPIQPLQRVWKHWDKWLDDLTENTADYSELLGARRTIPKGFARALKGVWSTRENPHGLIGHLYRLDHAGKGRVADIVTRSVLGNVPQNIAYTSLSAAQDITEKHAKQIARDSTMQFSRQVNAKINKKYEYFQYRGPNDGALRPFCSAHIENVYTRDEIQALVNGQTPSVFTDGGGYNCRHVWRPVKKTWFTPAEWTIARTHT